MSPTTPAIPLQTQPPTNTPPHPWRPGNLPTASPFDPRYSNLFTRRIENTVDTPKYRRAGSTRITGTQAFALVKWLNSAGFNFSRPRIKGPNSEGIFVWANETSEYNTYYTVHNDPTPEDPDDSNANDLGLLADFLGGYPFDPFLALMQLAKEAGINPVLFAGYNSQVIVNKLTEIFGPQ